MSKKKKRVWFFLMLKDLWFFELRNRLRGVKNSEYFLDSWTHFNSVGSLVKLFFHQERFLKLFDPRIWSILLSRNSEGSTSKRYFTLTIKCVVFFVVGRLLYDIQHRNMVERKNLSLLRGFLPIPINSIGSRNDTLEESFGSSNITSNIHRLIVSLLYLPKGKKISESGFLDPKESTLVTKRCQSKFSDIRSELHLGSSPTEGCTRDQKLLKKQEDLSFVSSRRSENQEMVNIFKIIAYLQKTVSIHPISSDPGCDRVPKDEPNMDSSKKISFLNNNPFFDFFHLFHDQNRGGYTLHHNFESEERFQEMADLFTLSIIEPDPVYHKGFGFSIDSCGNFLKAPKEKIVVFASNKIIEAGRCIRNEIRSISYLVRLPMHNWKLLLSRPDRYFMGLKSQYKRNQYLEKCDRYLSRGENPFEYFIFQWDRIGKATLNHRTRIRMKSTINQDFSNLKKSQQKGFDSPILIERSMNRDPDAYRYKCFNGRNLERFDFEHFVSEQKSRFFVLEDWFSSFLISFFLNKKNDSKPLRFLSKWILFLSNSLPLFFVSLGNMPIHRYEIHISELKGPNDQLCNPLLKSLGLQIVHLKKWKAEDHETSKKSKLLINGRTISPFLFNKIPKWKWMIDSFHTRKNRRRSFDNTDSYFSMIFRDQDSWLNPVKDFHRSSLISSFFKANQLPFLNNPHHFFFYCNKGFPFYMEKARINNYDFTYRQFLKILLPMNKRFSLCVDKKKHAFLERDTISPIESTIFIPNDFPQRGDERDNLYKSFHFPIRSDLFVRRTVDSITDISGTPLTEEERVNLERTYCQPLSDISDMSLSEEESVEEESVEEESVEEESVEEERTSRSDMGLSEEESVEEERTSRSDMGLSEEESVEEERTSRSDMGLSEKRKGSEKRKKRSLPLSQSVEEESVEEESVEEESVEEERTSRSDMGLSEEESVEEESVEEERTSRSDMGLSEEESVEEESVEEGQMDKIFQRDSAFSNFSKSKWNLFQTYMPWFLTSTGYKYLNFLFLDTLSDLQSSDHKFRSSNHQFLSIFHEIMHIPDRSWRILRRKWLILNRKWIFHERQIRERKFWKWTEKATKRISGIPRKVSLLYKVYKARTHRNNESPLISTNLSSPLFYSILLLLLLVGYLVHTHLVRISRISSELQTELKGLKSVMIPSYNYNEVRKFQAEYPRLSETETDSFLFWLKRRSQLARAELDSILEDIQLYVTERLVFVFGGGPARGVKVIIKNLFLNPINLIFDLLSFMEPIAGITYLINRSYLSHTSKEMYSWIREEKYFETGTEIEYWIENDAWIFDCQRDRLVQFSTLRTKKGINQILWSLTHSDPLLRNYSGYPMFEQPGAIYLRYLVDIHKKDLLNYEVNTSCLAERRIFLAHYQTIAYSRFPWGGIRMFDDKSIPLSLVDDDNSIPFSLGLGISPPRGILVIGSQKTGRDHLVRSLAKTSYLPFIKVLLDKEACSRLIFNELEPDEVTDVLDNAKFASVDVDSDSVPKYYIDALKNADLNVDIDNVGDDLDSSLEFDLELEELTLEKNLALRYLLSLDIELACIDFQFEFVRAMGPCIVWIPNIHHLDMLSVKSLAFFSNYLSGDCEERRSIRNTLFIASTYLPHKVDPALIAPSKLATCIKIRRLPILQQRKHLFTLSHTRGFRLEKTMFHTNSFGSGLTMGYSAQDLVALNHHAVSLTMAQKKSIIDTHTVRLAFVRQTWTFHERLPKLHHGIPFYQIGRAVVQHKILSKYLRPLKRNCPLDLISIYMTKQSWYEGQGYLCKWFFELGTDMKIITIFIYLLSCSAGLVAQDLWSLSGPDGKNWPLSYGFIRDDSTLIEALIQAAAALEGCLPKAEMRWPGLRNRLDMMQVIPFPIFGRAFIYKPSHFLTWQGEEDPDRAGLVTTFLTEIPVAPTMWQLGYFLFDWSGIRLNPAVLPFWVGSFLDKPIYFDDDEEFFEDELNPFAKEPLDENKETEYKYSLNKNKKRRRYGKSRFRRISRKAELKKRRAARAPLDEEEYKYKYKDEDVDEDEKPAFPFFSNTDSPIHKLTKRDLREIEAKIRGEDLYLDEEDPEVLKSFGELDNAWDFCDYGPTEQTLLYRGQFLLYPGDPLFFISPESRLYAGLDDESESESELESQLKSESKPEPLDQNTLGFILTIKGLLRTARSKTPAKEARFLKTTKAHYLEFLCNREQELEMKTLSSLGNEFTMSFDSFRSTMKFESYQYLSNLFLSKASLLDEIRKTFRRKTFFFPEEMQMELKRIGF
uniref:hypothetical chloroplast RF2 n=1 Tax=Ceratostigma plumbaginoides TaxID=278073 RepID=UPI00233E570F|nr:hypothetical chloroplast RF2 [Ceratostigma plumbaginoides]YP_010689917.1 hypothetical chloroplast RF2 [Ceratostigma plumbaginoides]WBR75608.1 hypothetical chloroplast RF2 [Ceratostigma plumbaginoides]WBR75626.1 hypothetical chloroplast RF2 [Ceratostigma plumbaginoides]WBR75690.1 hypothetical chloroplast RF2 [Ceratostigma plumbaginoides]WBR75708.1 hypothetical chloroplast RF2 [Ceratostigma plumbaginoides]